jgi:S1-C subfamily serine protease
MSGCLAHFFKALSILSILTVCEFGTLSSSYANSALSKGHREALKRGCKAKVRQGEYTNKLECYRQEKSIFFAQREVVTLDSLRDSQKKRFQLACMKAISAGIFAYDECLYTELTKLGLREARSETAPQLTSREEIAPKFSETPFQKLSTSALVARLEKGTVLVLTHEGTGSGFFIAPNLIVTNQHVIEGSLKNVFVTSRAIGRVRIAKVIAKSKAGVPGQRDFALLSIAKNTGSNFYFAVNYAPKKLESVVAAGYPGLIVDNDESFSRLMKGDVSAAPDLVLSRGEISASQTSGDGVDTLAHTAQIMPGNSGGPLVDACGRVVGINTYIAVAKTGNAGFAISAREVLNFLTNYEVTAKVDNRICQD